MIGRAEGTAVIVGTGMSTPSVAGIKSAGIKSVVPKIAVTKSVVPKTAVPKTAGLAPRHRFRP